MSSAMRLSSLDRGDRSMVPDARGAGKSPALVARER